MPDETIARRLREPRAYHSGAPESLLRSNSTPQNTEGWDSLANLNLMAAIEEEFGITVATRDRLRLRSRRARPLVCPAKESGELRRSGLEARRLGSRSA